MSKNTKTNYIFFTGGVSSSLGKGVTVSVMAFLLMARGYTVRLRKFDPYINVDAGTISPLQHGEVYVTEDGSETDLDLGHYERFTRQYTTGDDNFTTGRIYNDLINQERRGNFLGQTVQVVPHITDLIQNIILAPQEKKEVDFCLIEIGGTVGDIEGLPYIEAIRQLRYNLGIARTLFMHMTWVPYLGVVGEYKTKPTQHGVKELLSLGIKPDILICRSDSILSKINIDKISMLCSINPENIISAYDLPSIYLMPKIFNDQFLDVRVLNYFKLPLYKSVDDSQAKKSNSNCETKCDNTCTQTSSGQSAAPVQHHTHQNKTLTHDANHATMMKLINKCETFAHKLIHSDKKLKLALVGKYIELPDAYLSVIESTQHAAVANDIGIEIVWIDAMMLESMSESELHQVFTGIDAMIMPGGYGKRACLGKMLALRYARLHDFPTLAICLGMQLMVIELCRNILKLPEATSTEFDNDTKCPVVITLDKWRFMYDKKRKIPEEYLHKNFLGATMRLGSYPCHLKENTLTAKIYGKLTIYERHRHRYEMNDIYLQKLEAAKVLLVSGVNQDTKVSEIVELPQCSYFIGCQYHPEFKSNFMNPHPLFIHLLKAAIVKKFNTS